MFQNVMTSRKPLQDLSIEVVQDGADIPEDENYTKESKNNSQESVPCLFYNLKDCSKFSQFAILSMCVFFFYLVSKIIFPKIIF